MPALVPAALSPLSRRRVVVLGSTGSIGTSCLDVIATLEDRLQPLGLSAHSNWETLFDQAARWHPRWITVTDRATACNSKSKRLAGGCELLFGEEGLARMVSDPDVDIVVTAIVGSAGLAGTWAALEAGKTVAVANK